MKIGILTQPLRANYGGVLQNYALQQVLKGLGYEPETLEKDYHRKTTFFCILSIPKRIVTKYILKRRKYILHTTQTTVLCSKRVRRGGLF